MLIFLANTTGKAGWGLERVGNLLSKPTGLHSKSLGILTGVVKSSSGVTTTTSAPIFILPNGTFFVELVIFLVVFGVLARFVIPPVVKAMKEREELLSSSLTGVTEAKTEAVTLLGEADAVLTGARLEARQIIEGAALNAATIMADAKAKAMTAYNEAFDKSQHKIEDLRKELMTGLETQAEKLIIDIAGTMVPGGRISVTGKEASEAYSLVKAAKSNE